MPYTKEQLLKLATKNLIVNKEVAKLVDTKTMTRRLKTNLKEGDVFWLREPARVLRVYGTAMEIEFKADNTKASMKIPKRFYKAEAGCSIINYSKWISKRQGIPNGCIKELARHFYQVVSVHSERLQDITSGDIIEEGFPITYTDEECEKREQDSYEILDWWITLWNSTAPKGKRWEDNPMVEVIEYKEQHYD